MVEFHAAGRVSMQDVEEAEMRLLDARRRLGELDRPTWHRARAVLIARAAERTHLLDEAGVLPAPELQRVRLALERERLLAGDDNAYATNRDAFLAATKDRNALRVAAGFASAKSLEEEYGRLESEFPTADVAKAQDR